MFLYKGYQEAKARRARESESSQKSSESTGQTEFSPDEEPSDKKSPREEPPLSTELEAHLESMTRETLKSIPLKRPAPTDPEVVQARPRRRHREPSPAPRPRSPVETQPSGDKGKGKTKSAGWPSDATERKTLNVEELDLERSYVDSVELPSPKPKGDRPTRWKHPGKEPLTDPARLPKGWTTEEPDLDEEDLEAQIERCHERIEDNVMPDIFKHKLKELKARKAALSEMMKNKPKGLSWGVIQRIDDLEAIQKHNEENGDKHNQLKNIKAIIREYKSGRLSLTGLVTYWSNGKQLCQPRPFDWDELEAIQKKHCTSNSRGFWVENMNAETPQVAFASIQARYENSLFGVPKLRIAIRLPGRKYWADMLFLHDTGASMMHICEFDVDMLAVPLHAPHNTPARPMIIAQNTIHTLAGPRVYDIIEIEASILDEKGRLMCPWERIPTAVNEGPWKPCLNERLDGPFTRGRFYTANVPDGNLSMQIANDKSSLKIKRIDTSEIKPLFYGTSKMVPKPYPITSGHSSVSAKVSPEYPQPSDKDMQPSDKDMVETS